MSLGPHSAPKAAFRTSVASVGPEAAPWYPLAPRRRRVARRPHRTLQAELERWQLRGLARPLFALIDWWGSTPGVSARRVTKRVLRASPVARMVALAAAAVMVTVVATLAPVVVAIAQLIERAASLTRARPARRGPRPSPAAATRSQPSVAGLVGRQRGGDVVEACAERDGDGLGLPAAASRRYGRWKSYARS
jgi:hypothetical protein